MKQRTPFWVEGMDATQRVRRVGALFDLLDRKLAARDRTAPPNSPVTFVFVPDPPPRAFHALATSPEVHPSSWGVAGQAISTASRDVALQIAPRVFDLWPESLYVVACRGAVGDSATLSAWIGEAIERELGDAAASRSSRLPPYGLVYFDWGDLVGDVAPH